MKNDSRESNFELIRIIACLMIFSTHLSFFALHYQYKAFLSPVAVPSFFLLIGLFMFNRERDYKKLMKYNYIRIVIPCLLLILFTAFFKDFIYKGRFISHPLSQFDFSFFIKGILSTIIMSFSNKDMQSILPHLWFLRSYFLIILGYPIFRYLCTNQKENNLCRRILLINLIFFSFLNDLENIYRFDTHYTALFGIKTEVIYLLLGYEIGLYKNKVFSNQYFNYIISVILIAIGIFLALIYKQYAILNNPFYYGSKDTIINIFKALGFFILIGNIGLFFKKNKIINYIASKTFGIYLIHFSVIHVFTDALALTISEETMYKLPVIQQILLEIFYCIILFVICFLLVILIEKTYILIYRLFQKEKKKF